MILVACQKRRQIGPQVRLDFAGARHVQQSRTRVGIPSGHLSNHFDCIPFCAGVALRNLDKRRNPRAVGKLSQAHCAVIVPLLRALFQIRHHAGVPVFVQHFEQGRHVGSLEFVFRRHRHRFAGRL